MDLKLMWDGHQDAKIVSAPEMIIQPHPWTQEKSTLILPLEIMMFLRHMFPIIEGKLKKILVGVLLSFLPLAFVAVTKILSLCIFLKFWCFNSCKLEAKIAQLDILESISKRFLMND